MRWNLEWIRTFRAIYELGTLSAAARELYVSQPGVSLHLNALEDFAGHKLFDRSPRRMVPTERGKIFYNSILEPMQQLERAEEHFHKSSRTERATISVGMCFETFQYTLEEHVADLPFNLIIKFGEYAGMQQDLSNGLLDLIVTPRAGKQKNLTYDAFSKERIVLVAGGSTDVTALQDHIASHELSKANAWLRQQLWYSTAADTEHLKRFWRNNFGEHPDFSPNYIVPNISSIIRCLSGGTGFSVVPDFLCREAIAAGDIQLIWEGDRPLENILYFGYRNKTIYEAELQQLQQLFRAKWMSESRAAGRVS